ncbi:Protein CBG20932 [Caenorhabditis briggsae]|uniref:Protein CBG20932 n=1 Tax=Caenorhabditis briggsae TaxID=6238 RepID=A8XYZ6_CAEBR|nr:Protein CBG20932 [Caenorhabditis briggsae]CAP37863.2 Protein CBG20932 [Caenorhabditis briggsae]
MPSTNLIKRDWEKDHVYLVQFPRAGMIPSPSPYAFKLETFLRVADIPYTSSERSRSQSCATVGCGTLSPSGSSRIRWQLVHGNIPTARVMAGPNFPTLNYNSFRTLTTSSARCPLAVKSHSSSSTDVSTPTAPSSSITSSSTSTNPTSRISLRQTRLSQEPSSLSPNIISEEVLEQAKKDLDALSVQLGEKKYLFGNTIKTIDVTTFAHLAELIYTPQFSPEIATHLEEKTPNLLVYVKNIRDQYWPDWDETTETMKMDTVWKKA